VERAHHLRGVAHNPMRPVEEGVSHFT
jgi:hypothetical protein